jgi:hypothetical protein
MASITTSIALDVAKYNHFVFPVKQGDYNSRFYKVQILNNEVPLSVPQTATVLINARRSDGESASFMGTVNSDGTVTIPVTDFMMSVYDIVNCSVSILEGDTKLSTLTFSIDVQSMENETGEIGDVGFPPVLVQLIHAEGEDPARAIPAYIVSKETYSGLTPEQKAGRLYLIKADEV